VNPPISRKRVLIARVLAIFADLLQIGLAPFFAEGALSPFNAVLDVAMAAVLSWLVGWHWVFAPSFLAELVPVLDVVPTWTAAVFFVTRGAAAPGSEPRQEPHGKPAGGRVIDVEPVRETEADRKRLDGHS
jgi:hypothetical protein